jgi:hypothetical protein
MRLVRLLFGFSVVSAIGSAVAALALRNRLVSRGDYRDDEIELVTIFDSHDFTSTATSFRHAAITTMFGGGTLDLRLATLDPAGATISSRTVFGGWRIAVPGTWRVEQRGIGLFGGFRDSRNRDWGDPSGPRLRIEGFALFGGMAVVSETPDLGPARPPTLASAPAETATDNRGLTTDIEQVPPPPSEVET